MDSAASWLVLAVGIAVGVLVLAVVILAIVRRNDPDTSSTMTGDQWFTLGIVLTGAGVVLTTSVGPGMLGMVALG